MKRVHGSANGSEIRRESNASNNLAHERPASQWDDDMIRASEKSERRDKEPYKDIG